MTPKQTSTERTGLFRVDLEERRTLTYYVRANSYEEAREDVEELEFGDNEWNEVDRDFTIEPSQVAPKAGAWIWSGGPEGMFE